MATKKMKRVCLLQKWLDRRNWEAIELAEFTGIPKSQISQYISNKRGMSLDNAATIAHALNIDIEELYTWVLIDS